MTTPDALHYAVNELEGVLYDLRHQFNPNDGGVCARTVERVIKACASAIEAGTGETRSGSTRSAKARAGAQKGGA